MALHQEAASSPPSNMAALVTDGDITTCATVADVTVTLPDSQWVAEVRLVAPHSGKDKRVFVRFRGVCNLGC